MATSTAVKRQQNNALNHFMNELQKPTETSYEILLTQLELLLENNGSFIANAANFSSFVFHNIPCVNWAGFYFKRSNELILGPFQGEPACARIALGTGVCGKAAAQQEMIIVNNVHEFPGHITCSPISKSEIVVPIITGSALIGVFDVDSPVFDRFGEKEKQGLRNLVDCFLSMSRISELPLEIN